MKWIWVSGLNGAVGGNVDWVAIPDSVVPDSVVSVGGDVVVDNDIVEAHGRAPLQYHYQQQRHHPQKQPNPEQPNPESQPNQRSPQPPHLIRKPKSISSFIAGFKSVVNTKIDDYIDEHELDIPKYNRHNHFFQPNYHDHIIRNGDEYLRIKNYIRNNPRNWEDDSLTRSKNTD